MENIDNLNSFCEKDKKKDASRTRWYGERLFSQHNEVVAEYLVF
jgi:primosomal protein N''